jgi:hypothetical protein
MIPSVSRTACCAPVSFTHPFYRTSHLSTVFSERTADVYAPLARVGHIDRSIETAETGSLMQAVLDIDGGGRYIYFVVQSSFQLTIAVDLREALIRTHSGGCPMNLATMMIKLPSAFLPVGMSVAALATVLGHVVMFGAVREADEGTAAHIFQLLMMAEVPIVAFFAIKWLPRVPRQALQVLALQTGAGLVALAPVYFLDL